MKKIDKHIQVVRTQTVRQSSMGEKSCLMIRDVLRTKYQTVDITNIDNEQDLEALVALQPDLVFLGLKQTSQKRPEFNGEGLGDIWVSEYLAQRGINFTGSSHTAMALDQNKALAKRKVAQAGLPTAPYFTATPGQYKTADELPLGFPLFVKPPNQGGGKGIAADSVVHTFAQYQEKVQQIQQLFAIPALVETYLGGREFSVGLLGAADTIIAMPVELIANANKNGDRILGQEVKAADTERVVRVPSGLLRAKLIELAKNIYNELGARDYGRIDIRMDAHRVLYFLEANLVPGLAHHDFISYFTHACWLNERLDHAAMILKIVEICLAREDDTYGLGEWTHSALEPLVAS